MMVRAKGPRDAGSAVSRPAFLIIQPLQARGLITLAKVLHYEW